MWILYAFLSAIFAGITSILAKIGLKNTNSNVVTAIRTLVVLIFAWLVVLIAGTYEEIPHISGKTLFFLIASGMATGASWLCYFKALTIGDVNKVTPVDKTSTVLAMIIAIIFLHESLTWIKVICMVLILVGTLLMIEFKETEHRHNEKKSWLFYAVLSAIFAAITSTLGKIGVTEIDSTLGTAIRTIVVLIMAWIVVFVTGTQREVKRVDRKNLFAIVASGITTGGSWIFYFKALQTGDVSVVVPIDKLSIIVTVAFSAIFLKERVTLKSGIGLLLIVAGTLLLLV